MRKLTNDWQSLIDVDFPDIPLITEKAKLIAIARQKGYNTIDPKKAEKFLKMTPKERRQEYEKYRKKILNTPLP